MSGLMEIGQFSKACGLTVPALRHYDEVGLLKPASVNPQTSYRRYHPDQIHDAQRICSLRGVDLPIDEIRLVLAADRETDVEDILRTNRRRLGERAARLEQMLATSAAYLDSGVPVPTASGCRVVQIMVSTRDHDESVRFYREVFDFTFDADISSFILGAFDTESFFLLTVENWLDDATPSSFGILVDDIDARDARAINHGARRVSPPTDYDWKPRSSVIDDPSGNRIQLSQA